MKSRYKDFEVIVLRENIQNIKIIILNGFEDKTLKWYLIWLILIGLLKKFSN